MSFFGDDGYLVLITDTTQAVAFMLVQGLFGALGVVFSILVMVLVATIKMILLAPFLLLGAMLGAL